MLLYINACEFKILVLEVYEKDCAWQDIFSSEFDSCSDFSVR